MGRNQIVGEDYVSQLFESVNVDHGFRPKTGKQNQNMESNVLEKHKKWDDPS